MRASEYVAILQTLIAQHGDLDVEKWLPGRGRHAAPAPLLAFTRKFPAKRDPEGIQNFYHAPTDSPAQKGDPVFRV